MPEPKTSLQVLVTGGDAGAGFASVKALLKRGHRVAATTDDADGALRLRLAGALPVYPDLRRASEIGSALRMIKADALVHAAPQALGGAPQSLDADADSARLPEMAAAVAEASKAAGLSRLVALSFACLYQSGSSPAVEGDRDARAGDFAPMLEAEAILRESGIPGRVIRSGYIYGGHSPGTAALAAAIKGSGRPPSGALPASWLHEDDLASAIAAMLEADSAATGMEIVNAAADHASSPDEFAAALSAAIGLSAPAFSRDGFLDMFRAKTLRDQLLSRAVLIDGSRLRERLGWSPRHAGIGSGLEATALVWRMKDAVDLEASHETYDDRAAEAIASFAYDIALPAPEAEAAPAQAQAQAAPEPAAEAAPSHAPPPPSAGPTPWNESEAKREERRRKALERKARRAAKQAGG